MNIINDFVNSKFFNELQNKYQVVLSFIGGSRGVNCNLPGSDFDVFVLVKDKIDYFRRNLVEYYLVNDDGEKMHITLFDIESYVKGGNCYLTAVGMISNVNNIKIFYENSSEKLYAEQFKNILNSQKMKQIAILEYYNYIEKEIFNSIDESNVELIITDSKEYYELLLFIFTVINEDDLYKEENLKKIRAIRTIKKEKSVLPENLKNFFIKNLKKARKILNENFNKSEFTLLKLKEEVVQCKN